MKRRTPTNTPWAPPAPPVLSEHQLNLLVVAAVQYEFLRIVTGAWVLLVSKGERAFRLPADEITDETLALRVRQLLERAHLEREAACP